MALARRLDDARRLAGFADVAGTREQRSPSPAACSTFARTPGDDDLRAGGRTFDRGLAPEVRPAAGDEDDAAGERVGGDDL